MTENSTPKPVDGWDAHPEVVAHVHTQATSYISAQQQAAQASDQRAVTFASIMIPTALALLIFTISGNEADKAVTLGALLASAMLWGAAGFAVWSARPVDFYFPGTEPWCWWESQHESFEMSLSDEVVHLQDMIDENDKTMRASRSHLNCALRLALFSPALWAAVWIFTTYA